MPGHACRARWYVNRQHDRQPFMTLGGAYGQVTWVDPVAEITIARLGSIPREDEHVFGGMFNAFHTVAKALHGG